MCLQALLAKGRTLTSARCGSQSVSSVELAVDESYFLPLPARLGLRSGSGVPQALADLETHRPRGRDLQALAGPQVATTAGAELIILEATEADEVFRLALADGSFDPREHAHTTAFTAVFGCPVSVATPSIKHSGIL